MPSIYRLGRSIGLAFATCLLVSTCAVAQASPVPASGSNLDLVPIVTGLLSGIVGAALTQSVTIFLQHRKDKGSARYLAMRIAVILEGHALACGDLVGNWETYVHSGEHAGSKPKAVPTLPDYPDEDGWEALKPDLLERALTLRNQVAIARREVAAFFDIADEPDDVADHLAGHVGVCGYMAWTLAGDLRRRYRLAPFDLKRTSADVAPILRRMYDRIVRDQAALNRGHVVAVRRPNALMSG